jgi:hypothetical protein
VSHLPEPPRAARLAGAALIAAAAIASLGGCRYGGGGTDAAPPIDAGDFFVTIGTPTDVMEGFAYLNEGDTVELVMGSQGGTMCFLKYIVPESAAASFTGTVTLTLEGDEPFVRGPFVGHAELDPALGYVTLAHRLVLGDMYIGDVDGRNVFFEVTITDVVGRTATSTVNAVLRDLILVLHPVRGLGDGESVGRRRRRRGDRLGNLRGLPPAPAGARSRPPRRRCCCRRGARRSRSSDRGTRTACTTRTRGR